MMRTVTVQWLEERGACRDQVKVFKRLFGERARITKTNLLRAHEAGLDFDWFTYEVVVEEGNEFLYCDWDKEARLLTDAECNIYCNEDFEEMTIKEEIEWCKHYNKHLALLFWQHLQGKKQ